MKRIINQLEQKSAPAILFKYKPCSTMEQFTRILDILTEKKMYFPNYKQLNDPLEGLGYDVELDGYAGMGLQRIMDQEDSVLQGKRYQYRILSLSENCFSKVMWAHYANEHSGVCIGFWKKAFGNDLKQVEYLSFPKKKSEIVANSEQLEKALLDSFFYKHIDWNYEKEWRVVKKQEDFFWEFDINHIACVIIGGKIDRRLKRLMKDYIDPSISVYITSIGCRTFGINLLPFEYSENGTRVNDLKDRYIRTEAELEKDIARNRCFI